MATTPVFTAVPHIQGTEFTNASSTTKSTVYTPGASGSRIEGIEISSNDGTARNVAFWINDGTTDHYLGVVAVPIGSGYTTVARVEGITTLAGPSGVLTLPTGYVLKAAMVVAVTSTDTVSVVILGADF